VSTITDRLDTALVAAAHPVTGHAQDYDALLERVGERRVVLIGEATHGTHDFYRERARITRRLIEEKGFTAVAVEADWPDAYRVNRYVMGQSSDHNANQALSDFERFPSWMWRNTDVVWFVEWLRARNDAHRDPRTKARFYGLDLYSLRASIQAVIRYLDQRDPAAAAAARRRYGCFDHVRGEGPEYGHAVALDIAVPCEDEVVAQLLDLQARATELLSRNGLVAEDEYFFAERNAVLVHNAERYYRAMYRGRVSSWNLRDEHMAQTLDSLVRHLDRGQPGAKVVVWEHNSHVGDARATELGAGGELNVGQLARSRWPDDCFLIGFTTYDGEVTAASSWGSHSERKRVRPALAGSYEERFHRSGLGRAYLLLDDPRLAALRPARLERAIGVIYRPDTERTSHWFHASLPAQFDAVIHLDRTRALEPLERTSVWDTGEPPETYPSGL
jgi:erythromycin esterase-like protein